MPLSRYLPKTRPKLGRLLCHVAVVAVWAFAQYELADLRDMEENFSAHAKAVFSLNEKEVAREHAVLDKCELGVRPLPAAARDCLIRSVPELTDWQAARLAEVEFVALLQDNPSDSVAQQAGIKLMDQAWASWYRDYQPAHAKLDAMMEQMVRSSWLFRLTGFTQPELERTMYRITQREEMGIVAPEAFRRLVERTEAHPDTATY